jgi:hypothetical protein
MLQHLEYLRGLHLEAPRTGNSFLEDSALLGYLDDTPLKDNLKFKKEL